MLLFVLGLKTAESKELAKTIVAFYRNEGKEVFKHIINDFKKQNVPVRTIYNIVAKYRKRNSTSDLLKGIRRKQTSNQQLQALANLVDNKAGVSQPRLPLQFALNQSTISRHLKKQTSVRIHKRRIGAEIQE